MEPILASIRDILLSQLPAPAPAVNGGASVVNARTGGTSISVPEDRRADMTIFLMIILAIQMYVSYLFNLHIAVRARVVYAVLAALGLPVLLVPALIISFVLQFLGYMRLFHPRNGGA